MKSGLPLGMLVAGYAANSRLAGRPRAEGTSPNVALTPVLGLGRGTIHVEPVINPHFLTSFLRLITYDFIP